MKSSETIGKLAEALSIMQIQIDDAPKDSQAYGYKYADLGTVLALIRPVLHAHGLSVVQIPCNDGDKVGVSTRIMHTSGEWLEDTVTMEVDVAKNLSRAQAAGSVITYCRRYSLASVTGIAQIDDDNQVAYDKPAKQKPAKSEPMPTDEQYAKIQELHKGIGGTLPIRRSKWLNLDKPEIADMPDSNWNKMTAEQAKTIIKESE